MRTLLLSALVIGGLVFARPARAGEDPLAPLTMDEDPLAPLTADPAKPVKPGKPKPKPDKPKPPPPDKPVKPPPEKVDKPPPPEKPVKPPVEKVETPRKANADKIKVSGVPPMPLKAGQSVTLTFKVTDPAGKPVAAELHLLSNIGTITAPVETAPGIFTATFAAPATGLDNIATIRAEVKNGVKAVSSETKLGVVPNAPPPPPKPITATPEVPKKPKAAKIAFADVPKVEGSDPVKVRFQVEDDQGNVIPPEGVSLKADQGTFENVREESGTYVADFVPAKGHSGDVALYAEADGARLAGKGSLSVSAGAATTGNFGFAAGLFVGGLTNFGKVASPQFELNVEAKLFKVIRLGVLAGYSPAFAPGVTEKEGTRQADFTFTVIPLMVRAAYQQAVGPIDIFGGGMIGIAYVEGKGTATVGGAETSFNQLPLDMAAFIGGGVTLGPGMLLLEVRASWMKVDYKDATVAVVGNLGGFSGALGYKFEF